MTAAAKFELADLARQAFDAHSQSKRHSHSHSDNVNAMACSFYRGQFAVMVKAGSAHKSEWSKFASEIAKLKQTVRK